jgi:hypothetical protein
MKIINESSSSFAFRQEPFVKVTGHLWWLDQTQREDAALQQWLEKRFEWRRVGEPEVQTCFVVSGAHICTFLQQVARCLRL